MGCHALIREQQPSWSLATPPIEAAAWATQRRLNPVVTKGDFDGNRWQDWVALGWIEGKAHLAYCLAGNKQSFRLKVVALPSCHDVIYRQRRGSVVEDFDTGASERLTVDGVAAMCFEKAGEMIILTTRGHRSFVHAD